VRELPVNWGDPVGAGVGTRLGVNSYAAVVGHEQVRLRHVAVEQRGRGAAEPVPIRLDAVEYGVVVVRQPFRGADLAGVSIVARSTSGHGAGSRMSALPLRLPISPSSLPPTISP